MRSRRSPLAWVRSTTLALTLALGAPLSLAACASAPTYAPAAALGRPGYSEQRIESDRFRVVFRSGSPQDPGLIEALALRRAAEIAVEAGYDHFIVDRREIDRAESSGPRIGIGVGGGSYGRRSGFGTGVGMSFPVGGGGEKATTASLDIRLGRGTKPNSAEAYDARDVLRTAR